MIDYACKIYMEQQKNIINDKVISAWFCPDVLVAEKQKDEKYLKYDLNVELITAKTPIKERIVILRKT